VAQAFTDDLQIDAGVQQDGGVGMADVVQPYAGSSARSTRRLWRRVMVSGCSGLPSGWQQPSRGVELVAEVLGPLVEDEQMLGEVVGPSRG
jgi:hypothetical protein